MATENHRNDSGDSMSGAEEARDEAQEEQGVPEHPDVEPDETA